MKFFEFREEPEKPEIIIPPKPKVVTRVPKHFDREKVFNSSGYTFQYRGKIYECIGEDKDFQIVQFRYIVEIQEWQTMDNRVSNQLTFGPIIKEI